MGKKINISEYKMQTIYSTCNYYYVIIITISSREDIKPVAESNGEGLYEEGMAVWRRRAELMVKWERSNLNIP